MIQKYYNILGIQKFTTKEALKKAYRKKAKELHPDRNSSPNANEEFILLNEAYEYLSNQGPGNTFSYNHKTYTTEQSYQRDWEKEQKERARAKARKYAKMKREEYMNSAYYKKTEALGLILDLILNFIGLVILMVMMGTFIVMGGWYGVIFVTFLTVITFPKWKALITSLIIKDIEEYKEAISIIVSSYAFKKTAIAGFNLFLLFYSTVNTLIPPIYFIWIMVLAQIISFTVAQIAFRSWFKKRKLLFIFGIVPLLFNLPFFINYTFSSTPQVETYYFDVYNTSYNNIIHLEGDNYEEFPHLRTIFYDHPAKSHNRISYTFETGLFGIRVMKEYELHKGFYLP